MKDDSFNYRVPRELLVKDTKGRDSALFTNKGLTPSQYAHNCKVLSIVPLAYSLYHKGYPLTKINNFLICNTPSNECCVRRCGCGDKLIGLKNHCDLRICPVCADRKKNRLKSGYLPLVWNSKKILMEKWEKQGFIPTYVNIFKRGKEREVEVRLDYSLKMAKIEVNKYELRFLTISPPNEDGLKEGHARLKKSWSRFLNSGYVKHRVAATLSVVETKRRLKGSFTKSRDTGEIIGCAKKDSWNIHLHAIIFSRKLSNQIKGKCHKCGQWLIKKDDEGYYCSNSKHEDKEGEKCRDVEVYTHSKINDIWKKINGEYAHMDIRPRWGAAKTLNYMFKYISTNKEDISRVDDLADYLVSIKGVRLVSSTGIYFGEKLDKWTIARRCVVCGELITWSFNRDLIVKLKKERELLQQQAMIEIIPGKNS